MQDPNLRPLACEVNQMCKPLSMLLRNPTEMYLYQVSHCYPLPVVYCGTKEIATEITLSIDSATVRPDFGTAQV